MKKTALTEPIVIIGRNKYGKDARLRLQLEDKSWLVIDDRGKASIVAPSRRKRGPVHILNPFGLTGRADG
jgi:hypothetical protein